MSQLRNKLIDYLMVNGQTPLVIQEQPYTVVRMTFICNDKLFIEVGFSKVKWSDKWDAEYGVNMACGKAAAKIAKKLIESDDYLLLEDLKNE